MTCMYVFIYLYEGALGFVGWQVGFVMGVSEGSVSFQLFAVARAILLLYST